MIMLRLFALFMTVLCTWPVLAAAGDPVEVWRSPTCQCCGKWVEHLKESGFAVTVNGATPSMLNRLKHKSGIGKDLASCHTGKVGAMFRRPTSSGCWQSGLTQLVSACRGCLWGHREWNSAISAAL